MKLILLYTCHHEANSIFRSLQAVQTGKKVHMSVSGFSKKKYFEMIDMLVYLMGGETEDIILQFISPQINEGQVPEPTYDLGMGNFDFHLISKRNIIFERFKFNSRIQKGGQSVEDFITALYTLAGNCNYSLLKNELIRDHIVVGISYINVSERLQLQRNLSLLEAILAARQAEVQNSQNKILRQENEEYENK